MPQNDLEHTLKKEKYSAALRDFANYKELPNNNLTLSMSVQQSFLNLPQKMPGESHTIRRATM